MEKINQNIGITITKGLKISESHYFNVSNQDYLYIVYFLSSQNCKDYLSNHSYKIEITITLSYFDKYQLNYDFKTEKQHIGFGTRLKLIEILNCQFEGISRKLFLESMVLQLLFDNLHHQLEYNPMGIDLRFLNRAEEREKILRARDFMIQNLERNLTIPMIANQVGTNQCYLKKGFKAIIGQSVFEFLKSNRMQKSKYLLQNTQKSIQEISNEVGYASLSSFSQSFKKFYGINPSTKSN